MKRYQQLTDVFIIICKKCGSNDVDLHGEDCQHCGVTISAECNKCGQKYDPHNFVYNEFNEIN